MKNLISLIVVLVIFSCNKQKQDQIGIDLNSQAKHLVTYTYGSASCTCSGQVCGATGFFTDCCICIPDGWVGACGSLCGIASCKAEDPNSGAYVVGDHVTLHVQELVELRDYLNSNDLSTLGFINAFEAILNEIGYIEGMSEAILSNDTLYLDFCQQYESIINGMSTADLNSLKQHFNL